MIVLGKQRIVACRADQRAPLLLISRREIEAEPCVHVDEASDIFRALHVAAHPIKRIRKTAQHESTHVSLLPPPCDEFTTREPFFNATRVRPPGSTKISF